MSYQELMSEAANLPDRERRELIGHLLSVGRQRKAAYWDSIEAKITDSDPAHWVEAADLDSALRLNEKAE
jgi:hypothetical protein